MGKVVVIWLKEWEMEQNCYSPMRNRPANQRAAFLLGSNGALQKKFYALSQIETKVIKAIDDRDRNYCICIPHVLPLL